MNRAYHEVFKEGQLTLGLVMPIEANNSDTVPPLEGQIEKVQLAEKLGFYALWLRDIPFLVPNFNDIGQGYDPFSYLGFLAASTKTIHLGIASAILPLRHPAHVAKAMASVNALSKGRMMLGIASGDRPEEYPAFGVSFSKRGELFRESYDYLNKVQENFPSFTNTYGTLHNQVNLIPQQTHGKVPLLITGGSQQNSDWLAQHGDGWITYPREVVLQAKLIQQWRKNSADYSADFKPCMQSLYVDLLTEPNAKPEPIHLGFRSGILYLKEYLLQLQEIGVNHVALNLRLQSGEINDVLQMIAKECQPFLNPR